MPQQDEQALCEIDAVEVLVGETQPSDAAVKEAGKTGDGQAEHLKEKQKKLVNSKPVLLGDDNFDEIIQLKEMLDRKQKDAQATEANAGTGERRSHQAKLAKDSAAKETPEAVANDADDSERFSEQFDDASEYSKDHDQTPCQAKGGQHLPQEDEDVDMPPETPEKFSARNSKHPVPMDSYGCDVPQSDDRFNMVGGSLETIDEKSKSEMEETMSVQSEVLYEKAPESTQNKLLLLKHNKNQETVKCFMCNKQIPKTMAIQHSQECEQMVKALSASKSRRSKVDQSVTSSYSQETPMSAQSAELGDFEIALKKSKLPLGRLSEQD